MHDRHDPTDDATDDGRTDAPTDGPTPERPTDDAIHAVQMKADDGTDVVHYSNGRPGAWVRADRSDLVALEDSR